MSRRPRPKDGARRRDLRIATDDLVDPGRRVANAHSVERHLLQRDVVRQARGDEERVADVELRARDGGEKGEVGLLPVADGERQTGLADLRRDAGAVLGEADQRVVAREERVGDDVRVGRRLEVGELGADRHEGAVGDDLDAVGGADAQEAIAGVRDAGAVGRGDADVERVAAAHRPAGLGGRDDERWTRPNRRS